MFIQTVFYVCAEKRERESACVHKSRKCVCVFYDVFFCSILGLFYFVLGNLHPALRSKMKYIHLAAIAPAGLIKTYGANTIMKLIVEDIKKLVRDEIWRSCCSHSR